MLSVDKKISIISARTAGHCRSFSLSSYINRVLNEKDCEMREHICNVRRRGKEAIATRTRKPKEAVRKMRKSPTWIVFARTAAFDRKVSAVSTIEIAVNTTRGSGYLLRYSSFVMLYFEVGVHSQCLDDVNYSGVIVGCKRAFVATSSTATTPCNPTGLPCDGIAD